ncbi:MAG: cytosine permease [Chloroflexi bacterium]|nr:MAG: cytosine permease [Chloroflexota bacterium]
MQTVEEVEKHVPVREGEYGERVATIEPGGVEYIALKERHGKPIHLFWTWLSPNLEFATVFIGIICVAFLGLNLWQALTAIVIGSLLGSITHGVLSSWGPKFGVPMMVVGRGAFGSLGNILPASLNGLTATFGWFIVNSVSGAFALQALLPFLKDTFWLAFLIIVVAQVTIATLGHNLIHMFERWALPLLGVVFALACVFIFVNGHYDYSGQPIPGAWLIGFTAAFGYAAGWNPFAADYTRYLPPNTDRRMVGIWAGLGVFVSCVVLEFAGAVLVSVPKTDFFNGIPTEQLHRAMPDVVYYLTLLCIAVGAVAANAINIYSGTMSLVSLGIREMGMTLRQRRAVLAVIAGVIGFAGGVYLESQGYATAYENFLLLISYWIATWLAVVFVDYWLRHGDYGDESIFYNTAYNRWQGVVAMAVGLVVSVVLFANVGGLPSWLENIIGVVTRNNPNLGDITFLVGFVISGGLYYLFNMGLRRQTTQTRAAIGTRP